MPKAPLSHSYRVASSHFWRNVTLIALAHVVLLLGLIRWSVEARSSSNAQSIVWISGAEDLGSSETQSSAPPEPAMTPIPPPESEPLKKEEAAEETRLVTAAKSEIELSSPTPTPISTPKPTATPTPKPKATPKPTAKPARNAAHNVAGGPTPKPKKAVLAKASPKPSPKVKSSSTKLTEEAKKTDANAEKKKIAKIAPAKGGSPSPDGTGTTSSAGKVGHAGGGSTASEFGWYGNMLHDRFYSAWIQPTTTVASGSKISTLVKLRIEKDGRVSKFEIVKPSENVVVNESVAAIAKRVTEVDAPPAGLINGEHYDVKINFELNTEEEAPK
jgi:outer membrane biosynthesis protein TonB